MSEYERGRCQRVAVARRAAIIAFLLGWMVPLSLPASRVAAADPPPPAPPAITVSAPLPATYLRRLDAGRPAAPRVGLPVRLKIPSIFVDAAVEQVAQTPDGAMDAPKDYNNTAWYLLGPRPGETGNAVIDGHVDSTTGKAIFWDLRKLLRGDAIIVVGSDGVERRFVVMGSESYIRDAVPLDRVFGPTTGTHLNLITCDATSTFDRTHGAYAGNLVVYAEAAGP